MAKELKCGDLMPGCDTVIVGKDADEVFEDLPSVGPVGKVHGGVALEHVFDVEGRKTHHTPPAGTVIREG